MTPGTQRNSCHEVTLNLLGNLPFEMVGSQAPCAMRLSAHEIQHIAQPGAGGIEASRSEHGLTPRRASPMHAPYVPGLGGFLRDWPRVFGVPGGIFTGGGPGRDYAAIRRVVVARRV